MSIKNLSQSSDYLGAFSSGLCLIHCLATPFIFAAQSCSAAASCCSDAPLTWSMMDFLFIGISFFAVFWTVRTTSKNWMKYALWLAWVASFLIILNEKIAFYQLPTSSIYFSAFMLIGLHLYNKKYCKCSDETCCIHGSDIK